MILSICVSVDMDWGRNDASVSETMPVPAPIRIFKTVQAEDAISTNLVRLCVVESVRTAYPIILRDVHSIDGH